MVLIVLVLLTGPLAYLPDAALAAVVFVIAIELIDLLGMRRILALRKHEFAVALLTTAAVVVLGVEYGFVLAIIASIIEHLRHSYSPLNCVLVKSPEGHWQPVPPEPGARTKEGLVVYRFGTSLYYANASRLVEDVAALVGHGGPLRWLVIDCAAIADVDYTASTVLAKVVEHAHQHHVRLAFSSVLGPVRQQLDQLRHQRGPGSRCLLRHARPGPRGLPLHRALGEALMPVMSLPAIRACMDSDSTKVQMAPRSAMGPTTLVQQDAVAAGHGSARRHRFSGWISSALLSWRPLPLVSGANGLAR